MKNKKTLKKLAIVDKKSSNTVVNKRNIDDEKHKSNKVFFLKNNDRFRLDIQNKNKKQYA